MAVTRSAFGWSAASALAFAALQLGVVAVLARALAPAAFGEVAGVLVVLRLAQAVVELGVGSALVQRARALAGEAAAAHWLLLSVSLLAALIVGQLATPIASIAGTTSAARLVPWLAAWLPLTAAGVVPRALLERDLRFDLVAPVHLAAYALGFAPAALALAFAGQGASALVAGHLAEAGVKTALLLLLRPPRAGGTPSLAALQDLLRDGVRLMIESVSSMLALEVDAVIVGRLLGAPALGMYHRAGRLVDAPHSLLKRAASAPLRAYLAARRRAGGSLASAVRQSLVTVSALTMPLAAFGALHARDIVAVTLGARWLEVAPALSVMWLWLVLRGEHVVLGALLKVQGRALGVAWRTLVFAVVVVVAASCGGLLEGMRGAAAGVLLAHLVRLLLIVPAALSSAGLSGRAWLSAHGLGLGLAAACALGSDLLVRAAPATSSFARLSLALGGALLAAALVVCARRTLRQRRERASPAGEDA